MFERYWFCLFLSIISQAPKTGFSSLYIEMFRPETIFNMKLKKLVLQVLKQKCILFRVK